MLPASVTTLLSSDVKFGVEYILDVKNSSEMGLTFVKNVGPRRSQLAREQILLEQRNVQAVANENEMNDQAFANENEMNEQLNEFVKVHNSDTPVEETCFGNDSFDVVPSAEPRGATCFQCV